jgi:pimeloyl-ACP methyl ester carboxylesterase
VYPLVLKAPPKTREAYLDHISDLFERVGSQELEADLESVREMAGLAFDRRQDPRGAGRQLMAILASGNRTRDLRRIKAPTLVIHGTADRLVRPSGGRATARAIPGAKIMWIEGMGHDLPRGAWDRVIEGIERTARRAGERADLTTAG